MAYLNEPIAVIGSACKFPGDSTSPSKLWELLKQPKDVSRKIDRFRADNWHNTDGHHHGASNVLNAYLLSEDPKAFDAQFFSISGGEADSIDPQQRVLLETVYEGIESAGLRIESLQGSPTAVYVGVMCDDYNDVVYNDGESIPQYAATGTARSILSNRVSYFFNWTGPSMTIDTACSSSLVGVHQAVQVLRSRESNIAVAAGSNLIFGPKMFVAESNLNMLSPTGKSRMWDADADGYARGEGVACVVLKRLADAIADGDSIECIIRETGVNQDGRTPGITMPSSSAQAALIRQTYAKAGLDPRKKSDRCQYFEAHGTGTKAGDPREAGAIYEAFFEDLEYEEAIDPNNILHVGSIKTVIGHTEGTAGIAGLLKASLALQHKIIPPNMLFNNLNPDIEPFYDHLKIPTAPVDWPALQAGIARRASVNSFGFGGTNAHAIIEHYERNDLAPETASGVSIPFVFSATSEKSLVAQIKSHLAHFADNQQIDLCSAARTLAQRSVFNYRTSVSGIDVQTLCEKMLKKLEEKDTQGTVIGARPVTKGSGILGVFTGQGAQWAAMGRELLLSSPAAEAIIDELERSLAELPPTDRPTWSLKKEIIALESESRITEGLLSQPLCTALQVVLVDLLRVAGITFEAVVGHSSGEIGAAYAAGYIAACDAIRIAYYRGFYAKLSKGPNGEQGAMLAVGTSLQDATELCALRKLRGRLQVAACNSSASVTLSGDVDAAERAITILQDEGKFVRQLKVDTAYHSHHMEPCGEQYVDALRACQIELLTPEEDGCRWYSSVFAGRRMDDECEELKDTYWRDNMLKPVLFSQALAEALESGDLPALAIEIGPHPALKGPASQTIEDITNQALPYFGVLSRGKNDIECFADALGDVWTCLGPSVVNFESYALLSKADSTDKVEIIKSLPSYVWDHSRTHWYETRMSRTQRLRKDPPHPLLGIRTSEEVDGEYRWRNYIKPAELPWLTGHKIQGQLLFPGSGFAVLALESARYLATEEETQIIELLDFSIHHALSFPDKDAGVETMFILSNVRKATDAVRHTSADFVVNACLNKDTGTFTSMASGKLIVQLGEPLLSALPERAEQAYDLKETDVEDFYRDLATIGYNYSDMFMGITKLQRTADMCSGSIFSQGAAGYDCDFKFHPAPFDVGFQAAFAALGAPGDGRLWTLQIPTNIERIRFNPNACQSGGGINVELPFNAVITDSESYEIVSDIEIYEETGQHCIIQIEGLHVSPLSAATNATDRPMFAEMLFDIGEPDALRVEAKRGEADARALLGLFPERCMLFYLKQIHDTITPEERKKCDEHRISILNWAAHVVDVTSRGQHPHLKTEWLEDTFESLKPDMDEWLHILPDFDKLLFVGERLLPFVHGEITMLEEFREHGVLDWFYKEAIGTSEYNSYLGGLLKQLSFRYPHMNILEIGAGTGSATIATIKAIENLFSSYTYTDISTAFFTDAQARFKNHEESFIYQKLNIENDVSEQGFVEHSYDVIIASNVLHATQSLEDTLKNTRKLLKPGGYLVLLEVTAVDWLRTGFMFCGFSDWWAGRNDGRPYTPTITQTRWDELFRQTGFSGVDSAVAPRDYMTPYSVMITQAVDAQMSLIRQPLLPSSKRTPIQDVVVVGGHNISTFDLVEDVVAKIRPFASNVRVFGRMEELTEEYLNSETIVLCLVELDEPVFHPFTPEKYRAMQFLTEKVHNILWVSQGALGDKPYSNMMHGVARCLLHERSDSRFQIIDVDVSESPDAQYIAETLIRLHVSNTWKKFATPYNPQWSFEREIYVGKGGAIRIARYQQDSQLDDRYNSSRRLVRSPLQLKEVAVEIISGSSYEIGEYVPPAIANDLAPNDDSLLINISLSFLKAFNVKSVGFLYLVMGTESKTGRKVLALVDVLRSTVSISRTSAVYCDVSEDQERAYLVAAAYELLANSIFVSANGNGHVLVHEPTELLANAIKRQAEEKEVCVTMISSTSASLNVKFIHPLTPNRAIRDIIPKNTTAFYNLAEDDQHDDISSRLGNHLPANCQVHSASNFFSQKSQLLGNFSLQAISAALVYCSSRAIANLRKACLDKTVDLELSAVSKLSSKNNSLTLVNWQATATVLAKVYPPEDYTKFRSDRTYFLVGLTGELGTSLCRWMIARGARYIALTSRNPKVSEKWLSAMAVLGAVVKVFPMDITNRRSLMSTYRAINQTLPPIVGVCNGAMVLTDGLLANMPYETFNSVIRPKVEGTILLDELFPENNLDFFMVFSSLTCVTGNIGQSPYAASNCFMVSMAEGRRRRGLAGSVINLAGIFGIGYINRTDKKIHERLGNMGYGGISEWDFQQFFAEAAIASHPDSRRLFEVSNGLKSFEPKDPAAPAWLANSKFGRYVLKKGGKSTAKSDDDALSMKAQLMEQTSVDGVYDILLSGFIALLYQKLNMPPEENGISPDSSLIELGIDSLIAVDVRAWFTKELGVEVQILMLLGGASIAALIEDTAGKLDPAMIPCVKGEDEEARPDSEDEDKSGNSSDSQSQANTTFPTSLETSVIFENDCDEDVGKEILPSKPKLEFEKVVSMPHGCSQFWSILQFLEDPHVSNIEFRLQLNSNIDVTRLELALRNLGQRHEALRTAYFADPERPNEHKLGILSKSTLEFVRKQISDPKEAELESKKILSHTWDIKRGEVAKVVLLSLNPTTHFLIFGFHHIAIDGFSFNLILNEMNALYDGKSVPAIECQFSDWAVEQRREAETGLMSKEIEFWRRELRVIPEPLPLLPMATVNSRRTMTNYEFVEAEEVTLDQKTISLIKSLCRRHKVSMFNFFLAVFKIFLFRYIDTERICIGMADAGRGNSKTHRTVGYLLNLLPLVFEKLPTQKFGDALREARGKSFDALLHSKLPFRVMLDEFKIPRSSTYNPLFQAFIDYRQMNAAAGTLGAESSGHHTPGRNANDIILDISTVSSEEIRATFKVQKSLYSQEAAGIMLKSYLQLVTTFAVDSDYQLNKISLSSVSLFDRADIRFTENLARGGRLDLNPAQTTSLLIDEAIASSPENIALKDGLGNSLTYSEMGKRIDQICRALMDCAVSEGEFIGIFQEPTVDWICSLLAIWKLGTIYVPLDPRQSSERLSAIINDCKPSIILSHQFTELEAHRILPVGSRTVDISKTISESRSIIPNKAMPYSPSTVLYTSGSTGKPKGVLLNHFGLLNHCIVYASTHGFGREYVLQQSAFSFDMAPYQTIIALYNGGSVYVASKSQRLEPSHISRVIADEGITCTIATPSEYFSWFKHGSQHLTGASRWKFAVSGGEAITHGLLGEFRMRKLPNLRLLNVYGPSEISIGAVSMEIDYKSLDSTAPIPLGRPMRNYAVYIVDENFDQVPCGIDGELIIAGAGIADGYWNKEEMTKSKFLPDTITPRGYFPGQWAKMYRTGDIGRRQKDGSILFKGRATGDVQVKLNGIRIELSDVENVIVETGKGAIMEGVCSIRSGVLIAHVEFSAEFPNEGRQQFLRDLKTRLPLPFYMSPSVIIGLDKMPLTNHGKIDRTAIASLSLQQDSGLGQEVDDDDLTETEIVLKGIWEEILPAEIVGSASITSDTDFFSCGGSSLNIVNVQNLIRERLNVSLPIVDLLQSSVLRAMASKADAAGSVAEIDWNAETRLDDSFAFLASSRLKTAGGSLVKKSGLSVVLTGATGYLGRLILDQLVNDSRVSRIHCIAVRSDTDKPRDMLTASSKILIHAGNLADTNLGLSKEAFEAVAGHADAIIHNGANRSFWDHYHIIKGSNFGSTKELVKLSAARKIPFHFISSSGVVGLASKAIKHSEASMAEFQPPVDGKSGYIASKWASEVYIEKATKAYGLPLHIHRVMPSTNTSDPPKELLQNFLAIADEINVVPDWEGWSGSFDVIDASGLASNIVNSAMDECLSGPGRSPPPFVHHICENKIQMANLQDFISLQSDDRSSFDRCAPHEWAGKAKRAGITYHFAAMDFQISDKREAVKLGLKR